MPTTTGLSASQLRAKINELKAQGKEYSTSKSLAKYADALKVLEPQNYDKNTVSAAQTKLKLTNEPTVNGGGSAPVSTLSSGSGGMGLSGGGSSNTNLMDIYNTALSGVSDLQTQLDAKKTARDTALATVNDNPFYTEATRVGKQGKVNEAATNDINTLQGQIDSAKADAQVRVNIATQQYNIDDKNYQNQIQKLNILISSGAIANASSSDIAQIAQATGMTTSMVKGIVSGVQAGQVQTSVVSNTDDNGNVTVSVINTKTGEIIANNSLGSVSGTKTVSQGSTTVSQQEASKAMSAALNAEGVKGPDGHVSESSYMNVRNVWASYGFAPADFDALFFSYINPKYAKSYNIVNTDVKAQLKG
jgi:hypothetical protein